MAENSLSQPLEDQPDPKRQKMSTTTTSDDEEIVENGPSVPIKPKYKRRKIAIFFAFCGVGYQGMQKNPGAKTIEGDLEEALYLSGAVPEEERGLHRRYDWARSARTDKGVSAVGQVVSGKFFVEPPGFVERLNSNLSPQIRIFGFKRATPSFSAKKFCDRRRYVYLIPVFALDPSCHRNRESVLASVGSENELVKCVECSERGRKVYGIMGKRSFESKTMAENVEIGSGISKENKIAVVSSENNESGKNDSEKNSSIENVNVEDEQNEKTEDLKAVSSVNSAVLTINETVVVENEIVANSSEKEEDDADNNNASNGTKKLPETGAETIGKVKEDEMEYENADHVKPEKKTEFCYGEKEKERFNRILKYYEGTHNFHNFTTRTKAEDPSAIRYILSFNADTIVNIDGIDFVKCVVVGQSFMLHQIRKMIGLAVAIMRNLSPESLIVKAFEKKVNITVPMAPEVGLYLDECIFSSYNRKWKNTHEELSMKDYAKEAEDFKMKYIYSHVASAEHKDGAVALWLHSLNYRNYPDLRVADTTPSSDKVMDDNPSSDKVMDDNPSSDKVMDDILSSDKVVDDTPSSDKVRDDILSSDKVRDDAPSSDMAVDNAPSSDKVVVVDNAPSSNVNQDEILNMVE
ncbi:hypothetical protein ACS0TY_014000 [Phlomoides rotata]